jgi:hypothetical protein
LLEHNTKCVGRGGLNHGSVLFLGKQVIVEPTLEVGWRGERYTACGVLAQQGAVGPLAVTQGRSRIQRYGSNSVTVTAFFCLAPCVAGAGQLMH